MAAGTSCDVLASAEERLLANPRRREGLGSTLGTATPVLTGEPMNSEKRLPGQSNADFGRSNPNNEFIGTQSVAGGGDPSFALRLFRAIGAWRDRRRATRS